MQRAGVGAARASFRDRTADNVVLDHARRVGRRRPAVYADHRRHLAFRQRRGDGHTAGQSDHESSGDAGTVSC